MPSDRGPRRSDPWKWFVLFVALGHAGCSTDNPWGVDGEAAPAPQPPLPPIAPDRGFGTDIPWRSLDDGLALTRSESRPMMLIVHASWCRACKALKQQFHEAPIPELARRFVMVNLDQDVDPVSHEYAIDGRYVPRVFFVDPETGEPDPRFRNDSRDGNRYYYASSDDLAGVMRSVLEHYDRS